MTTRARAASWCPRCDAQINPGDPIVLRHGDWCCTRCASGAGDED